mgnify:CR=1 FL=1
MLTENQIKSYKEIDIIEGLRYFSKIRKKNINTRNKNFDYLRIKSCCMIQRFPFNIYESLLNLNLFKMLIERKKYATKHKLRFSYKTSLLFFSKHAYPRMYKFFKEMYKKDTLSKKIFK